MEFSIHVVLKSTSLDKKKEVNPKSKERWYERGKPRDEPLLSGKNGNFRIK